jgi:hypothetical protein
MLSLGIDRCANFSSRIKLLHRLFVFVCGEVRFAKFLIRVFGTSDGLACPRDGGTR